MRPCLGEKRRRRRRERRREEKEGEEEEEGRERGGDGRGRRLGYRDVHRATASAPKPDKLSIIPQTHTWKTSHAPGRYKANVVFTKPLFPQHGAGIPA